DLPHRRRHVEELRSVDLRKFHLPSRLRGPFHRERVADDGTWIAVALERPGVNDLSTLLRYRRQSDERAVGRDAGLLLELPLGSLKQVLARVNLALGDRPCA